MNNKQITDEILINYLNNRLNDAEKNNVERWLKTESNKQHFEKLKTIWNITDWKISEIHDTENAWEKLQHELKKRKAKNIHFPQSIARIAAALLLAVGLYAALRYMNKTEETLIAETTIVAPALENSPAVAVEEIQASATPTTPVPEKKITAKTKKNPDRNDLPVAAVHNKEEICNNTSCPLEICIRQSLECDGKATTFSHCSLLQPDASGLLHYKSMDATAEYCQAPVEEISIKKIGTGETIVLNAHTSVTAQEFFDYITGDKKGNIVAGIFETDCNNHCIDQSIRIDNRFGTPMILQ